MNTYNVFLSDLALSDLMRIHDYVANELREPAVACSLVCKIKEAVDDLEIYPKRHPLVSDFDLANKGYRIFTVGNYLVFYVVTERDKTVSVARILYNRRDWSALL